MQSVLPAATRVKRSVTDGQTREKLSGNEHTEHFSALGDLNAPLWGALPGLLEKVLFQLRL